MSAISALPGFSDPVCDAQRTFRRLLGAMAEPAVPALLTIDLPDLGIDVAALAIALTLGDADTRWWFADSIGDEARKFLRFHTGMCVVDRPGDAAFALAIDIADLPPLAKFCPGSAMEPELSTTIIAGVGDYATGMTVLLDGPGFAQPRPFGPAGFDDDRWNEIDANHAGFPAGVDLVLASGASIACIPRSTRITARERSR
jgi:alpha-D-ribose 1-methylphosphonate 5-triphosphate synthase subunit PhnH